MSALNDTLFENKEKAVLLYLFTREPEGTDCNASILQRDYYGLRGLPP